jgi:hypothetical protein
MEQADGGGAWLEEVAARRTGWRRGGAPSGGEAARRLQERPHSFIRAQSVNPKTLYARKAAKAPTLKRFCGVRGGNWTPWRRLGAFGDAILISGVARATPQTQPRLDA